MVREQRACRASPSWDYRIYWAGWQAAKWPAVRELWDRYGDRVEASALRRRAGIGALAVLVALNTYRLGHGVRGGMTWQPVPQVVDALEGAFELTFGSIPATKARTLLALDVSGSMTWGQVAGMTGINSTARPLIQIGVGALQSTTSNGMFAPI